MKRISLFLLICAMAVSAQAMLIDDFENFDMSNYTYTVILDLDAAGGSNTSSWQAPDGALELNTTSFQSLEQSALVRNGLTLNVGQELQVDVVNPVSENNSDYVGLYVGGTAPVAAGVANTDTREDCVMVYINRNGGVSIGGKSGTDKITGNGDFGIVNKAADAATVAGATKLFIKNVNGADFEMGWYIDTERIAYWTYTPDVTNSADYVGLYADARTANVLGTLDNLTVVSVDNDCGAWGYSYADIDEDCSVNLQDFALLASSWLLEDLILTTDINSDGIVSIADIDLLLSEWLACSLPNNEDCQNYDSVVPIVQMPDIEYKLIDGYSLKMYYRYEPEIKDGPLPCVVFFHGGGWTGGDPVQMEEQCKYFASRGMICMSADYRVKDTHGTTPFECVKDGKSAVRWIRANAAVLGVDPDKIIAGGASAGGHVAACTDIIVGYEEDGEDTTISSRPNALFLLNPVVDTTEDGYGSEKFDPGEDTLISPVHHIVFGICPTIIFHGTVDTTVPFENVERFTQLMHEAGNSCKLVPFEGEGHGFFNHVNFQPSRNPADFNMTVEMGYEFFLIHALSSVKNRQG